MSEHPIPVPCPQCGEAQNMIPGGFTPEADPFGPVTCMVCGHEFTKDEYLAGLKTRAPERDAQQ